MTTSDTSRITPEQRAKITEHINKMIVCAREFDAFLCMEMDQEVYGVKEARTLVQSIKNRINDIENTL